MKDLGYLVQSLPQEAVPDKGIYKITQVPFDFIHNILPEKFQNLPVEVMVEGFGFTYLLTKGLQLTSKKVFDKIIPGFDEKWLPWFERACVIGLPVALGAYALIDQEGAKYWIYGKPMDNLGIFMAYLGGLAGAIPDLNKKGGVIAPIIDFIKHSKKPLEEKIKKKITK